MIQSKTVAQFAHKLKVNRSTVYRMILSNSLPAGVKAITFLNRIVIEINPEIWKQK